MMMMSEAQSPHRPGRSGPLTPPRPARRVPIRALTAALGWVIVILCVCLAALWLWRAGQPAVAWSVAVTAVAVLPAALAGAAAARRDLRRSAPAANMPAAGEDALNALAAIARRLDLAERPSGLLAAQLPSGARAVACTGPSGALLALWDQDGQLVHEHAVLTAPGPRGR
jgi:hypothetical protein